jgi:hypothetical protein
VCREAGHQKDLAHSGHGSGPLPAGNADVVSSSKNTENQINKINI